MDSLTPCFLLELTRVPCGERPGATGTRSPTLSDEEYLSPQEEAMEVGESPAPSPGVHFKEPPSFQVEGLTESHCPSLLLLLLQTTRMGPFIPIYKNLHPSFAIKRGRG